MYIGETIDFERRKREHRDAIRRGEINSSLFQHMQQDNHSINFVDMRKIVNIEEVERRRLVESILIQNTDTYNIQQSNFKLDQLTSTLLNHNSTYIPKLLRKLKRPP